MKNKAMKKVLSFLLAGALVLGIFPFVESTQVQAAPPNPNANNSDINAGVNFTQLYKPGNFIYYGEYQHALAINTTTYAVTSRESTATPILWRVAGEEASDNNITLYSEYILDTRQFDTSSAANWGATSLRSWLNNQSGFGSNFTGLEWNNTVSAAVATAAYNDSSYLGGAVSSSTDRFYLPWGTPNNGTNPNLKTTGENGVWWSKDNPSNAVTYAASPTGGLLYEITSSNPIFSGATAGSNKRSASLKLFDSGGPASNIAYRYWLRNFHVGGGATGWYTQTSGNNDTISTGSYAGIRPIFKLNPDEILFATEITTSYTKTNQMDAVTGVYRDGGRLGTNASAYKLTLHDNSKTTPSLIYDYDETLDSSTSAIYIKPGDMIDFDTATLPFGNALAYKVVEKGTNGDTVRYGHETASLLPAALTLKANNIYLDSDSDSRTLSEDDYVAYVWAQQDSVTQSHVGATPHIFTLTVEDDSLAPAVTVDNVARSSSGNTATVNFTIGNDSQGKYYYVVDPATIPTTAGDIISDASKVRVDFNQPSGPVTDTINLTFSDNNVHDVYLVAKDRVRNESTIQHIIIPTFVSNTPPVAISPLPDLEVFEGASATFNASSLASDPDGDTLTVVSCTASTNTAVATVSVSGGVLQVNGIAAGTAYVDVTVSDGNGGIITIPSVAIIVHVTPAEPTATPSSISMAQGDTKAVQVHFGLGFSAANGASITSDDTSVATVSPSSLSAGGSVNVSGVKSGTANITITWSGVPTGIPGTFTIPVTVTSGGGPSPGTLYTLTYAAGTGGSVSSSYPSGGAVASGTVVQVTAASNQGYKFAGWRVNGVSAGSVNPGSFTITQNTTITATFTSTSTGGSSGSSSGGSSGGGSGGGGSSGGSSNLDGNVTASTSSTTNTAGGGGYSGIDGTTATPYVVDVPKANTSLKTMTAQNRPYALIRHNGPIKVLKDAFQTFGKNTVYFDSQVGKVVKVRVTLREPEKITTDMMLSGFVEGTNVTAVKALFEKWYGNQFVVIHLDQTGTWGQAAEIAAKVDLTGMNTKNLYFYSYDKKANTYVVLTSPNYWIDTNGYLRFTSEYAGDIIVSDGKLAKR